MSDVVNERKVFQGGARIPALASQPVAVDSSGNVIATARVAGTNFSTASLAASASENDDVTLNKITKVLKISTNRAARVRAYSTSAYRTADASRAVGTDPTGDHGLLLEVVTTATMLSLAMAPPATLYNGDSTVAATVYFRVQNLDTGSGVVTVTMTLLQEE